jgi:hypothetical protein
MAILRCKIIGLNPNGCFTWRRTDAEAPRGVLPQELTPPGIAVGSEVRITLEHDAVGRKTVIACDAVESESNTELSGIIQRVSREPIPAPLVARSHLAFGQIRWTSIMNPLENATAVGKYRPALIVSGDDHRWRVMGFTTKSYYEDGSPRVPIPDYAVIGLPSPGYFWGTRLTRVDPADIGDYIGDADASLLRTLLGLARADLTMDEIAAIRAALRATAA